MLAFFYDLILVENFLVIGWNKLFCGVGEWNQAWLIVKENYIEYWLNGFKVLEYERNMFMYWVLVVYSKYKDWLDFGELFQGYILLQDYGNWVFFWSIKIWEF